MNILITGSSSGFGKLAVPLLLERGHTVVAALRGGESRFRELFDHEVRTYPGRIHALDLHMEKPETFDAAVKAVADRFGGKLDVLINNAGYGLFGAVEDQTPEQLRHQMEVNFFGPVLLTRALLPSLRAARGRIINLSSIAGLYGFPSYGSYNASKFAFEAITEGMYYDLKPHGVQVALIEPGGFKTDFSTRSKIWAEGSSDPKSPYFARAQAMGKMLGQASPRLGDPIKVARLIVRLSEQRRIPLRTSIGADAKFMIGLGRILPTNWRVRVIDWFFGRVVYGGK